MAASSVDATAQSFRFGGWRNLSPPAVDSSPRVMLALSGGGARGLAAIGVFKAFEEKNITIAGITGVSMGAIIGGLAACGYTAQQLESIVVAIDFSELLLSGAERNAILVSRRDDRERHLVTFRFNGLTPQLPTGLLSAPRLTTELNLLTVAPLYRAGNFFDSLPIPFRTIATDIISGDEVLCDRGSLAEAMRASMAFPLAFTGLERDSSLLMDGGMRVPIPVSEAKRMRTDSSIPVVAVDMTTPLMPREKLTGLFEIASQVTGVMTREQMNRELAAADIILRPDLSKGSSVNFEDATELIAAGYEVAIKLADSLRKAFRSTAPTRWQVQQVSYQGAYDGEDSARALPLLTVLETVGSAEELIAVAHPLVHSGEFWSLDCLVEPVSDSLPEPGYRQAVRITVRSESRPRLGYQYLRVVGNREFAGEKLIPSPLLSAEMITASLVDSLCQTILSRYHKAGFQLVKIDSVQLQPDTLSIWIDEGVIRRIDVVGNKRSKDWLVRSYANLQVGRSFRQADAHRGLDQLLGTGLFEQVRLEVIPAPKEYFPTGGIVARVLVLEQPPAQLRLGGHWNEEYEGEVLAEILDDNLAGVGLQGMLHTIYGERRLELSTRAKLERIFQTYLTAQGELYLRRREHQRYDADFKPVDLTEIIRTGIEISLGQQFRSLGLFSTGLRFEEVDEKSLARRQLSYGLRTLFFRSVIDTYDRRYFATSGTRQDYTLEFTGKVFGGKVEYTRFSAELEHARSLSKSLTLLVSGSLGLSRQGLPYSEQFTLSGSGQLPGYRQEQITGEKLLDVRLALRQKIPLGLYGTMIAGAGNAFARTEQIKLSNLRTGIGLQLSLDSPAGPLELGYGTGDAGGRWWFTVGLAF